MISGLPMASEASTRLIQRNQKSHKFPFLPQNMGNLPQLNTVDDVKLFITMQYNSTGLKVCAKSHFTIISQ